MISMIAPVIAIARHASPAIASRFAKCMIRALSWWRNSMRWWTVGAIRQIDAAAANSSVTM